MIIPVSKVDDKTVTVEVFSVTCTVPPLIGGEVASRHCSPVGSGGLEDVIESH